MGFCMLYLVVEFYFFSNRELLNIFRKGEVDVVDEEGQFGEEVLWS